MTFHWPPVWLSLRVAGCATAGALVMGLWLVYQVATRDFLVRKAILGLLALLLATPVVILAWVILRPVFPWQAGAEVGAMTALPPIVLGSRRPLEELNRPPAKRQHDAPENPPLRAAQTARRIAVLPIQLLQAPPRAQHNRRQRRD